MGFVCAVLRMRVSKETHGTREARGSSYARLLSLPVTCLARCLLSRTHEQSEHCITADSCKRAPSLAVIDSCCHAAADARGLLTRLSLHSSSLEGRESAFCC